jgi:hypothetical protein
MDVLVHGKLVRETEVITVDLQTGMTTVPANIRSYDVGRWLAHLPASHGNTSHEPSCGGEGSFTPTSIGMAHIPARTSSLHVNTAHGHDLCMHKDGPCAVIAAEGSSCQGPAQDRNQTPRPMEGQPSSVLG